MSDNVANIILDPGMNCKIGVWESTWSCNKLTDERISSPAYFCKLVTSFFCKHISWKKFSCRLSFSHGESWHWPFNPACESLNGLPELICFYVMFCEWSPTQPVYNVDNEPIFWIRFHSWRQKIPRWSIFNIGWKCTLLEGAKKQNYSEKSLWKS